MHIPVLGPCEKHMWIMCISLLITNSALNYIKMGLMESEMAKQSKMRVFYLVDKKIIKGCFYVPSPI